MPSVRIIYDVDGWSLHHKARALEKYAPPNFDISLATLSCPTMAEHAVSEEPTDLILLFAFTKTAAVRRVLEQKKAHTRLITTWNSGWPHKLATFREVYEHADHMIVNNTLA